MKQKNIILLLILGTLSFCESCNHHTMNPVLVHEVTVSECISNDYKSDDPNPTFAFADGVLEIRQIVFLNCASSIIDIEAHRTNNILYINYQTDGDISANCFCDKEVCCLLQDIPAGIYKIVISVDGEVVYQQKHNIR